MFRNRQRRRRIDKVGGEEAVDITQSMSGIGQRRARGLGQQLQMRPAVPTRDAGLADADRGGSPTKVSARHCELARTRAAVPRRRL